MSYSRYKTLFYTKICRTLGVFFIDGNTGQFVPHLNAFTVDESATGKFNVNFVELVAMQL